MRCFRLNRETCFLKATRITCSIRQNQAWISASVNYNHKRKSKHWHYSTRNADLMKPEENKFDHRKNCLRKKKFSEMLKSEICTK